MAEWSGVVNTTAKTYLKGEQDKTLRDRKLLALMESRGRISYGKSGFDQTWLVRHAQQVLNQYGDGEALTYARFNRHLQLTLPWRGYTMTDLVTLKEELMNRGPVALINRYKQLLPMMSQDVRDRFCEELYVDGNATGKENAIHGIESFCGSGTTAAGDKIAQPSDTYAGKSTALGNVAGSWSTALTTKPNATVATDWPEGKGDSEYDYMSPKLLNYSSTAWGTSSTAWLDNSERVMRYGITYSRLTGGKEGMLDMYLLSGNLFNDWKNRISSMQRIIVDNTDSPLRKLGFGDVQSLDGVDVTDEYGVPANVGYGFNVDAMELQCLPSQLFDSKGPLWDPGRAAWLFLIFFFGNMKFDPKGFVKIAAYA